MPRLLALPLLALCSCATLTTPSEFAIPIESTPHGATVTHRGSVIGTTPCTLKLRRERLPLLSLELAGYHPQQVEVANAPVALGPLLFDCLLFPLLIVDVAANTDGKLDAAPIALHLTPLDAAPPRIWRRADYEANAPRPAASSGVLVLPVASPR